MAIKDSTGYYQEFLDNSFGLVSSVIAVRLLYPRKEDEEKVEGDA